MRAAARWIGRRVARDPQRAVVLALLLATLAFALIPLSPGMPLFPLDDAWALGINEAVARGFTFGRDVIFTFGPYSGIFSRAYHPATSAMILLGSGYLSLAYWFAVVELTRDSTRYSPWALWFVLMVFMYSEDALLLSYPMLVGVACCTGAPRLVALPPRAARITVGLLFSGFGLLPQIKGSVLVLCGLIGLVVCLLFVRRKRWDLAVAAIAGAVICMVVFWVLAGQPVLGLPRYLTSMLPLIFGYADAMAWPGDRHEITWYLVGAVLLLAAVLWQKPAPDRPRGYLLGVFAVSLFIAFKAGFVRHDAHALICSTTLMIAGVVAGMTLRSLLAPVALVAALAISFYITGHYLAMSPGAVSDRVTASLASTRDGLALRRPGNDALAREFAATMEQYRTGLAIPVLPGTTDVYSYGQTALIASGNHWNPRPIMQSYTAYGPLAARNRDHLTGDHAPDNILFRVESIDGRMPTLDDGSSWITLLERYRPASLDRSYLVLRRRTGALARVEQTTILRRNFMFGRTTSVPEAPGLVFAEIDVQPSLLGRLAALVYKPGELQITLQVAGVATPKRFRFIANLGRLGILLSPLVENTHEFAMLYTGLEHLAPLRVTAFNVHYVGDALWWRPTYRVTFKSVTVTPPAGEAFPFDRSLGAVADDRFDPIDCDGVFDMIDDMTPPPAQFPAGGLINAAGWVARSARAAQPAQPVVVIATGSDGRRLVFQTRTTRRGDVAEYFHNPGLENTGFAATLDVSQLDDSYVLGLGFVDGDRIAQCKQPVRTAIIKRAPAGDRRP
jgi:hypothetical protein